MMYHYNTFILLHNDFIHGGLHVLSEEFLGKLPYLAIYSILYFSKGGSNDLNTEEITKLKNSCHKNIGLDNPL